MSVPANDLSKSNLAAFGQPMDPKFDDKKLFTRMRCSYLALDFKTVEDRANFTRSFKSATRLRDYSEHIFRKALNKVRGNDEERESSRFKNSPTFQSQKASTMATVGSVSTGQWYM
jgi:hypothetical protein